MSGALPVDDHGQVVNVVRGGGADIVVSCYTGRRDIDKYHKKIWRKQPW